MRALRLAKDLARRQRRGPGGREFDRKRQVIELGAELGNGFPVRLAGRAIEE